MKFIGDTNKSSLFETVYHEIESAIIDGSLKPGESLTELHLSRELGVSRTPIREALRRLEQDELIRYVPNKGAVVIGISRKDTEDMYNIRMLIEGLAAEWAAQNITSDELAEMKETIELQEYYASKGDSDQVLRLDDAFHEQLYNASRSRMLKHVLKNFHSYATPVRVLSIKSNSRIIASVGEHRAIYEALENHDSSKGKLLAREHIENSKKNIDICMEK